MISFIIIGRNEGWKLTKCLQSVYQTIEYNNLKDYEVIYVDSKSTDDSIERAKQFNNIKIFQITGVYNAAIARNIGAKESKGEILFFVDADVELLPDFIPHVLINNHSVLKYDCVAGYLDNIFYDENWDFIKRAPQGYTDLKQTNITTRSVNGGIFLIKKEIWELAKGMRSKYRKNQDLDLALRLSKKGIHFTRVPFLMGIHHTIDYRHQNRMWQSIISGNLLYPSVTTRDHLFYLPKIKHTVRRQYTAILLLMFVLTIFFDILSFVLLFTYLILLFLKVYRNTKQAGRNKGSSLLYFLNRSLNQFISDILFWVGFIAFHPSSKKAIYKRVS
ncbi:MAG: glycosyltransferase family 2 protein [Thiohalospira sp.]